MIYLQWVFQDIFDRLYYSIRLDGHILLACFIHAWHLVANDKQHNGYIFKKLSVVLSRASDLGCM